MLYHTASYNDRLLLKHDHHISVGDTKTSMNANAKNGRTSTAHIGNLIENHTQKSLGGYHANSCSLPIVLPFPLLKDAPPQKTKQQQQQPRVVYESNIDVHHGSRSRFMNSSSIRVYRVYLSSYSSCCSLRENIDQVPRDRRSVVFIPFWV